MRSFGVAVLNGLRAHFKQPDGTSRAGTDWLVVVTFDGREYRVLVRAYDDEFSGIEVEQQVEMVRVFIDRKIRSGWSPDRYRGTPGELVLRVGT